MWYNFWRVHQTLRVTPAMEAGVTDHVWSVEENCLAPLIGRSLRKVAGVSGRFFSWFSLVAIVLFWGWVLRRGLKTRNTRNARVFVGSALFVFLVLLWSVYVSLTSSN